ncbi:LOW QUALITY PROTEIN: hypothetical protein Cgig2_017882 [Carnegiea gigantea]|uniref:Uncharacterized protein n=1 Tax=Carnegiea gigantea TaxID=171969 RepID=A0A9Q1Q9D6_9CARY|nr:LOW QUALITY PROTEIN: hypothetical protein Cgig2_017882 [Carnegiea gigantea]
MLFVEDHSDVHWHAVVRYTIKLKSATKRQRDEVSSADKENHRGIRMDEDLVISSGREYEPDGQGEEDSDGGVSLVAELGVGDGLSSNEEEEADGEGEESSYKMKRATEARDGIPNCVDPALVRGPVAISVRGRFTLEMICEMMKNLKEYQKHAIDSTIFKLVLEYKSFAMQRELTIALVMAWAPQRKGFRLAWKFHSLCLMSHSSLVTSDGEVVRFGDESDYLELRQLMRERIVKYVEDKKVKLMQEKGGKKPKVFRHYIKEMKKLCEANRGED